MATESKDLDPNEPLSFTDDFNDDCTIKFNKGKRLEIILIDQHGNELYYYLDADQVATLKQWL